MLDPRFIREHRDVVRDAIAKRGLDCDLDYFIALDERRRAAITRVVELRARQNAASDAMAELSDAERGARLEELKELKRTLADAEFESRALEEEYRELAYRIPNIPAEDVPVGRDESANVVIRTEGEPTSFSFEPKDHVALGESLGIIEIERAGKVVGSRFSYLMGAAALLEFALLQHAFRMLTSPESVRAIAESVGPDVSPKTFVPVVPPVMVRPDVFRRMARLSPEDQDERYRLAGDDLYLVGSAEHTLGPLHMEESLDEADLPLRYLGFSTSFRREAGSYGKDTRGIFRMHQFDKIEMESFATSDQGPAEHRFFVAVQEALVRSLGLPFRVVLVSTGDMGKPDARQVDIETWLPGQARYRETHTADYMTDYQARRLNTRVKRASGKTEFVHMNDATAFAIGRTMIAILENYQQADGSVRVPDALRPYMHGVSEIRPLAGG